MAAFGKGVVELLIEIDPFSAPAALAGEVIALSDPEYPKIGALITDAQRIVAR